MKKFTFVILGFTGNLTQLKIIPAMYDLESKKKLSKSTKILGVGRQELNIEDFVSKSLLSFNKDHLHEIKQDVVDRLVSRIKYIKCDFNDTSLYEELKKINGNILYYLATYPNLYKSIFKSIKENKLNMSKNGWVHLMVEKPIGNDLKTAKLMNSIFRLDFNENQIFRIDHYLGKQAIRQLFRQKNVSRNVQKIEINVFEKNGIGKRGIYYDETGALLDMGQSHILQMLAAVCAKSSKSHDRLAVLKSLVPNPNEAIFGQYEGFKSEENIGASSNTNTYFKIKTHLKSGRWKNIPIYLTSGKSLNKSIAEISIFYNDNKVVNYLISPLVVQPEYDQYEKLIKEAVSGKQEFFNSEGEVEASWKFIDKFKDVSKKIFTYPIGTDPKEFKLKDNS